MLYELTLGTTPVTLANQETAGQNLRVHLAALLINNRLLSLNDSTRLALVINPNDLVAQLELATRTGRGERLQDGNLALAVNAEAVIQVGNTGDANGLLARIETSHLLVGELEG